MLIIKNLYKYYKSDRPAIKDLSLEIKSGDIFGFIGHNGAGKTTTIKSVVGILEFEKGDIFIDGVSIKENPIECKKKIAYIPDNPELYDALTGIQYLNFIGDIYKVPRKEREELIKVYSDTFEITKSLGDLISSYSHGMKQKLAIISALIHKPKLLILDEPFVGLDPKASHILKQIMKDICKDGGAIFFSTHVLEVAEKLCNKIAIIKNGEIIISGDTDKVMELIENEWFNNSFKIWFNKFL